MPNVKRTGLTTIRVVAFKLCRLITASSPIIKSFYPSSTALHAALDAAVAACAVLVAEADNTLPVGD